MTRGQTSSAGLKRATLLQLAWSWLRQVSGDAAYENYLRCTRRDAPPDTIAECNSSSGPPLSRAEFYIDSLRRRYATVSRCC
jgi:uncharacterized short protein YbdD (DUF466 family)